MKYTFNTIELDTVKFCLLKEGNDKAIEPQVFNLIHYLIVNRNKVVSRDDLLNALWKNRVVSDATLSNHIKLARKIMGDDGQQQAIIKTIHGRGYQFIADLECNDTSHSDHQTTKPRVVIYWFVFVVLLTFLFVLYLNKKPQKTKQNVSIAVLVFEDLSAQSNQAYFAEGMSEELLNLFTKIPNLRVTSRTSSFSFKDKDMTLEQMGGLLNVSHILEGSVRKSGNKLRVTAQLIRVDNGSHLWSETYDYQMNDIFKIQDEIAMAVSQQLQVSLSKGMGKHMAVNRKTHLQAHALYLKSLYYFRENSDKSLAKALTFIDQSIKVNSDYAPSWTMKSRIHYQQAVYSYDKNNSNALNKAREAVLKARGINKYYAPVYAQMALVDLTVFDFDSARFNMELALSFKDKSLQIMTIGARYYQLTGQIDKSNELLNSIYDSSPINDTHYYNESINKEFSNDIKGAYSSIRKYGYFHANAIAQHALKSHLLVALNDFEKAKQEAEKEINLFWKIVALEYVYYAQGNTSRADELLDQMIKDYSYSPAYIASLYERRKDKENAFKWLNRAYLDRDINLLLVLSVHPLSNLLEDGRMLQLFADIGFKNQHWFFENIPEN